MKSRIFSTLRTPRPFPPGPGSHLVSSRSGGEFKTRRAMILAADSLNVRAVDASSSMRNDRGRADGVGEGESGNHLPGLKTTAEKIAQIIFADSQSE